MRMNRLFKARGHHHALHVIGDCDNCGHSVIYHLPIAGCIKCSCDEFS